MKSIKLSEDQKSRLLEMGMALFNNYEDIYFEEAIECGILESEYIRFKINIDEIYFIHWFEFCSRYLMSKLDELYFEKVMHPVDPYSVQNENKKLKYPDNWKELWDQRPFLMFPSIVNGTRYKIHPIDYLYKEFKNLK